MATRRNTIIDALEDRERSRWTMAPPLPKGDDYPENQDADPLDPPASLSGRPYSRVVEGGGTADAEPAPTVKTFSAADLLSMELPEPRWAVESIVPEGLSVLAGKPKLGKSWLAMDLALAVAWGGVALGSTKVEAGGVLFLALEDTRRRLQSRLKKLLSRTDATAPTPLTLATAWPRQDDGGLLALIEFLGTHSGTRLLVVDTWAKFRPRKIRGKDSYEEDYDHAGPVKALADRFGVSILILHHCRKLDASDPIDSVSGTLGLTGCADAVLVLKRDRGRHDVVLFLSGRDLEEQELALQWDPAYCRWSIAGQAEEYRMSQERAQVVELLRKSGKAMTPAEAAPLLGKPLGTVKSLFWHMAQDGHLLNTGDGHYVYLGANRAN
jgi:hypothetical protein